MFVVRFFKKILNSLGLWNKNAKLVFLGLDNAGKTTLLHMLKDDRVSQHEPTLHPHKEELQMGNIRFQTYDLGGHEVARRLWQDYFVTVDGVFFLVDASDRDRMEESKEELDRLLESPALQNVPFVVLGNKIDKMGASSEEELREFFGLLPHMTAGRKTKGRVEGVRPIEVFMCSVTKRMGYAEAFDWINNFIA